MRYANLFKNLANGHLYLAVKFGLSHADPLRFVTRRGVSVEVPRRLLQTFKEIFMDECYLTGLEFPLPAGPTVLDIGANAGYFSLYALSRFPGARVFAFEPVPANFRLLSHQREINPQADLTTINRAVAGREGELELALDAADAYTTSATVLGSASGQPHTIRVPATTLGSVFAEFGIERCDLLKLDCEGAEYDILYHCPAADLARIRQIAMEAHPGPGPRENIEALEAFLHTRGFETRRRPVGMLWAWRKDGP
jgi:FkbM family methyltransferase